MTTTTTEKRLREKHNARKSGAILVPLIEELLESSCEIDDEEDIQFLDSLVRARAEKREKGVFSPSMLGSCLRQAYFAKTQIVEREEAHSPSTNSYFIDGNFRHFKWQYALWKLHRAKKLELIGCEIRIWSTQKDFAGTLDALVKIGDEHYLVDFKGMNLPSYQKFARQGSTPQHRVQIVGYAIILNGSNDYPFAVKTCLLIGESKPGPVSGGSPIGLHEDRISVDMHKAEVRTRLKELRGYEKRNETPPPECTSLRHYSYQQCPYYRNCTEEVRAIQQRIESAAALNAKEPELARPRRKTADSS